MAVMFATTRGIVVPLPSMVDEVDVEPARHVGAVRHQEDVLVGEVELGEEVAEELHPLTIGVATAPGRQIPARHRLGGPSAPWGKIDP